MAVIRRDASRSRSRALRYRPASSGQLLRHILEHPSLTAAVRELPGPALANLIARVGLEDAGEIVAMASDEQLASVFDEDLWRADAPGADERFRPARFALWLEVLSEAGDEFVARRLAGLPRELLILAIHRLVLVLDMDGLAEELCEAEEDDAVATEKALECGLYEEWEGFRLIARDARVWDVLWSALLSLDRDHHELLREVLERCAAMDQEYVEDNGGLYDVLTSEEMLEADVSGERADRRAEHGFVSPADARAFLALARSGRELEQRDAVTQAYFRGLSRAPRAELQRPVQERASPAVTELLRLVGPSEASPAHPLLPTRGTRTEESTEPSLFRAALLELGRTQPQLGAERLEELAYLANVLWVGSAHTGRQPRPIEALERAMETCDAGLRSALESAGVASDEQPALLDAAVATLARTHADQLFRMGARD
ncbi:MAG: DUF6178 family protein [Myxococcales bacterium]